MVEANPADYQRADESEQGDKPKGGGAGDETFLVGHGAPSLSAQLPGLRGSLTNGMQALLNRATAPTPGGVTGGLNPKPQQSQNGITGGLNPGGFQNGKG